MDKIAKRGVSIFIDGKEVKNSVGSIVSEMKKLDAQQKKMTIGADDYIAHGKKIEYLKSLLQEHKDNQKLIAQEYKKMTAATDEYGKKHENVFSKAANWFNKYSAMGIGLIGTITGLSFTFRKLGEDVAKMDDVYSDVMKTTQMTHEEVVALNEDFKKFNTRTSREELNKIAEAGGRIGVTKENILEFTKAMDIANVALGDSFTGGVEEISTKLGKLKMLFRETKDMKIEKAYLSIASSINELGANGSASEENIAEFTTRLGSLQESLKPTIADTLGLGAAFEESGLEAEVSSRAYSIVLNRATTDTAKFAKVMGKSTKEVENLINTNPLEFFLQFAESMRGMSATDAGKVLDELKINADGANKAIGAATNNTERFRELLELSNKSFRDGTSVIDEYNIKNNNLAAKLDKAKKVFTETALELGSKLNPLLLKSVSGTTYLIKALIELPKWLIENRGLILSLVFVTTTYTIAINANRIATLARLSVEKTKIIMDRISTASTLVAAAAQALFTGNINRASAAMRLFNSIVKVNPYVALGVAIAAVTVGVYKLATRTTDAQKAISEFNREAHIQTTELNNIFEAYKRANPGTAEKARLLQIIKEKYGAYIKNLIDEKGNIIDIEKAQSQANTALRQSIALKIKNKYVDEYTSKEIENQADLLTELRKRISDKKGETIADIVIGQVGETMQKNLNDPLKAGSKEVFDILKKFDLMTGVIDRREFSTMVNSLASSYFRIGLKTKEFDAIFKSLIGDAGKVVDVMNGNTDSGNTNTDTTGFTPDGTNEQEQKKAFKKAEDAIEATGKRRQILTDDMYSSLNMSEYLYEQMSLVNTADMLKEKEKLYKKYGEDTADIEKQLSDIRLKQIALDKKHKDDFAKSIEDLQKIDLPKPTEDEAIIDTENYTVALRLKILEAFHQRGLRSEEEYQRELATLLKGNQEEINKYLKDVNLKNNEERFKQGLIGEKQYLDNNRAIYADYIDEKFAKEQQLASDIAAIANAAADISSAMQDAALMRIDNKYAKELKAAQKAGKDTTALETKIEEEKKQVKKKYADVDFAITAAQIIASTASAVMNALKLPPPFGQILAGLVGAAGVTQLAVANQQRQSIKNLWTGGFTGPGNKKDPKGIVHSDEFVSNSDATANPNLIPLFNLIDTAQRMGTVKSLKSSDISRALRNESYASVSGIRRKPVTESGSDNVYVSASLAKMEKTIDRLSSILDNGIEARSVISGRYGSYEQTKLYNKLLKNAKR